MWAYCLHQPERVAFSVAALLLALGLGLCNGLGQLDTFIRDSYSAPPPVADVVVVAIGPECVASVGRWPWPREVHADLLERISAQKPLAVGMDMVLAAPTADLPGGRRVAVALGTSPDLIPAVFKAMLAGRELTGDASIDPVPPRVPQGPQTSAAAMVVRHSLLTDGGSSDQWWRHIAVGIINTAAQPGSEAATDVAQSFMMRVSTESRPVPHESRTRLVSMPAPAYQTVTAREVLAGTVAPTLFAGRVVLVGVGASGLLDARALMRTGPAQAGGGVEASAGIAAALLRDHPHVRIEPWQTALFTVGMTMLLLIALWSQSPVSAFARCLVIVAAGLAASYVAWHTAGLWVAPGALLMACTPIFALLTYRLAGRGTLQIGFPSLAPVMAARLYAGGPRTPRQLLPDMSANGRSHRDMARDGLRDGSPDVPRDTLRDVQSGEAEDRGVDHQRELLSLRDLLMAAIESLPDIILVCQDSGRVVIGNLAAANYFGASSANLRNCSLLALLSGLMPADGVAWTDTGGEFGFARYQQGIECRDGNGAEFLLKCAPCVSLPAGGEGWIVSLIDVAALHEAERRRDDAMRFLSHDMRSPLTAILALLSLNREDATALPADEMLSRIRRLASRSLTLAESFVQLARAQPPEHAREAVDLADIVMDAADDCWSQAQSKRIVIDVDVPPNAAHTLGDRELIRRAVINLVNNAVKFSPRSSRVVCAVSLVEAEWCIAVRDEGRGIAFEDREQLFKKFVRLGEHEPDAEPGVGLGLAFTKTVVDRHNGRIEVDSVLGVGSEFRLYLKAMAGMPGA